MAKRAEDLRPSKHARRRMRLYRVGLDDLAHVVAHPESETPARESGRIEIDGPTPDGRRLRLIVPQESPEVIVTIYPLSPPRRR